MSSVVTDFLEQLPDFFAQLGYDKDMTLRICKSNLMNVALELVLAYLLNTSNSSRENMNVKHSGLGPHRFAGIDTVQSLVRRAFRGEERVMHVRA